MEFSGITAEIIAKAKLNKKRIVLPESSDLRVKRRYCRCYFNRKFRGN